MKLEIIKGYDIYDVTFERVDDHDDPEKWTREQQVIKESLIAALGFFASAETSLNGDAVEIVTDFLNADYPDYFAVPIPETDLHILGICLEVVEFDCPAKSQYVRDMVEGIQTAIEKNATFQAQDDMDD